MRAEKEAGMTSLNLIYMTRLVDLMALSNFSNKQIFLMFNRKYARLLDSIITQYILSVLMSVIFPLQVISL